MTNKLQQLTKFVRENKNIVGLPEIQEKFDWAMAKSSNNQTITSSSDGDVLHLGISSPLADLIKRREFEVLYVKDPENKTDTGSSIACLYLPEEYQGGMKYANDAWRRSDNLSERFGTISTFDGGIQITNYRSPESFDHGFNL